MTFIWSIIYRSFFLFCCISLSNCFPHQFYQVQLYQIGSQPQPSTLLNSLGSSEAEGASSSLQPNELKSASSLPIKCPNCDLCDGSGRYVDVLFIQAVLICDVLLENSVPILSTPFPTSFSIDLPTKFRRPCSG